MSSDDWTGVYDGSGSGWSQVTLGGSDNAVWFSDHTSSGEVTVTCRVCGHAVTVRSGDAPILYGDARLCEHFGGQP